MDRKAFAGLTPVDLSEKGVSNVRIRNAVYTTLLVSSLLIAPAVRPTTGVQAHGNARPLETKGAASIHLAPAGQRVSVPAIVAERLVLPAELATLTPAPAVAERIERFLSTLAPRSATLVDEVVVLRQPAPQATSTGTPATSGFLTAVSAVEKADKTLPYSSTNLIIRLYLFLPPALLDGSDLSEPFASTTVIPYAAAPVPTTYGDFLDWTLAHETWHLIDIQTRLDPIRSGTPDSSERLDTLLSDPARWTQAFPWAGLSEQLGMNDRGEIYAGSDELDRAYALVHGATRYEHKHGIFTVHYDDGIFAFERGFTRSGYLPEEIQHLSDLAPLLKSGRIPTLYALFNRDDERFAEFGAWWWFAKAKGAADRFARLYPTLEILYDEAWQAAAGRCRSSGSALAGAATDDGVYAASRVDASWRSAVSNPSANHPYTGATRSMAAALLPWRSSNRPKLTQARNSSDRAWRAWASSRARR